MTAAAVIIVAAITYPAFYAGPTRVSARYVQVGWLRCPLGMLR